MRREPHPDLRYRTRRAPALASALATVVVIAAACGAPSELEARADDRPEVGATTASPVGGAASDTPVRGASPDASSRDVAPSDRVTDAADATDGAVGTTVGPPTTGSDPSDDRASESSTEAADGPASTETTAEVSTPPTSTGTTSIDPAGAIAGTPSDAEQVVALRFESQISDVPASELADISLAILNDERGWPRAGFRFVADDASPFRVVLAEGPEVDALCLPLRTFGTVSCQNGPVVALNADRWRTAVDHWDAAVADYRGYLVNHEVGHLLGQRHPKPRCPVAGRPAGVMEQQTAGLEGCVGNAWPRDWEIERARLRPVVYAPLPDWGPDPVPANDER